jgi:hypothetical protein
LPLLAHLVKHLLAATLVLCPLSMSHAADTPSPQSIFYAGHSLLDAPLPRDVAAIGASLGTPLARWQQHTPPGSSIRDRAPSLPALDGYDTLLVTEQHTLIGNVVWNDSVGELRRLHERFVAANPRGQTWFYAPWLNLNDLADPRRWIAYERAAAPVWACVATLAAEGRADGIGFLPASALLAALVERAARGDVPGVTVASLFRDDVHLSALGAYFMALVVYATLFERSPVGAAVPHGLDASAARALQAEAASLLQQERAQRPSGSVTPSTCRQRLQRFVAPYAAYVRDAIDRPRMGPLRAWWLWAKHRWHWHRALRH